MHWLKKIRVRLGLLLLKNQTTVSEEIEGIIHKTIDYTIKADEGIYDKIKTYDAVLWSTTDLVRYGHKVSKVTERHEMNGNKVITVHYITKEYFANLMLWAHANLTKSEGLSSSTVLEKINADRK